MRDQRLKELDSVCILGDRLEARTLLSPIVSIALLSKITAQHSTRSECQLRSPHNSVHRARQLWKSYQLPAVRSHQQSIVFLQFPPKVPEGRKFHRRLENYPTRQPRLSTASVKGRI